MGNLISMTDSRNAQEETQTRSVCAETTDFTDVRSLQTEMAIGQIDKTPPGLPSTTNKTRTGQTGFVVDRYNMNHPQRGTAIIINNYEFDPKSGMKELTGGEKNGVDMQRLLHDHLGFENVELHYNLTVQQMKDNLLKVSKMDHSQSDCFVCVINTHGRSGGHIAGYDKSMPLDELLSYFRGENCQSLVGKPKLFFIDACRGGTRDTGVDAVDGASRRNRSFEIVIPSGADFLVAYSSSQGFVSLLNPHKGSWFTQSVVDVFTETWKEMDLLSMLTVVNKKVAYEEGDKGTKQMPCITSMLTKHVYFTKK